MPPAPARFPLGRAIAQPQTQLSCISDGAQPTPTTPQGLWLLDLGTHSPFAPDREGAAGVPMANLLDRASVALVAIAWFLLGERFLGHAIAPSTVVIIPIVVLGIICAVLRKYVD